MKFGLISEVPADLEAALPPEVRAARNAELRGDVDPSKALRRWVGGGGNYRGAPQFLLSVLGTEIWVSGCAYCPTFPGQIYEGENDDGTLRFKQCGACHGNAIAIAAPQWCAKHGQEGFCPVCARAYEYGLETLPLGVKFWLDLQPAGVHPFRPPTFEYLR